MSYLLKLKSGFFKTHPYILILAKKQIRLTPLIQDIPEGGELNQIVINDSDIISISLNQKKAKVMELEIFSQQGSYQGIFAANTNFEELLGLFIEEFGRKLYFVKG